VFPSLGITVHMALPRYDGPETLRRIRADSRSVGMKVFSVSSTHPREWNIPEGPAGLEAWFAKPLNPRRLWDAMQASLGSSAPAHAN
jgi:DNA-binding response OmpR family regulator